MRPSDTGQIKLSNKEWRDLILRDKIPYESGIARYREISRGPIVGDDSGMFKMPFHREDGRLLGCHCIRSGATGLIHDETSDCSAGRVVTQL